MKIPIVKFYNREYVAECPNCKQNRWGFWGLISVITEHISGAESLVKKDRYYCNNCEKHIDYLMKNDKPIKQL